MFNMSQIFSPVRHPYNYQILEFCDKSTFAWYDNWNFNKNVKYNEIESESNVRRCVSLQSFFRRLRVRDLGPNVFFFAEIAM